MIKKYFPEDGKLLNNSLKKLMFGGYKAKIALIKTTKITLISLVFKVKMINISKMN